MYTRKVYGQSQKNSCPFCGKTSTTQNSQKIPTCLEHKDMELLDLKCACGEWLDISHGKFGPFFICMKCGTINFNKGLEMNDYPLVSIQDL